MRGFRRSLDVVRDEYEAISRRIQNNDDWETILNVRDCRQDKLEALTSCKDYPDPTVGALKVRYRVSTASPCVII